MQARAEGVTAEAVRTVARPVTVGWFVKRTIIGIVILVVTVGGMAWLTYASIDPSLEARDASRPAMPAPEMVRTDAHL